MRLVLGLFVIAAAATAAFASTVPSEPSTILNVTYSVGSSEVSLKPGDFLNATGMQESPRAPLLLGHGLEEPSFAADCPISMVLPPGRWIKHEMISCIYYARSRIFSSTRRISFEHMLR
ncbi:hypothetical protein LT330_010141 [Penicillium expansum]|nr:hypothetical protein LT330_010141 [Penicillium expansum]